MSLTEDDTLPLLTSEFWVRPVYEKLLHAASRFNLSPTAELKRPTSNLVKIASHVKSKPGDAIIQEDQHTTMTDWLGADCPVDFLNVWFPAHWSPIVLRELHKREVKYRGNSFFLPCRARHDSSDGRSRLHTIRTQLKRSHS